ncbi:MAG TPA: hypothetical protein VHL53_10895 [Acidimicrobiia bacterium]|nr:hypothetical protein [Acidimicrobiia bacterium]
MTRRRWAMLAAAGAGACAALVALPSLGTSAPPAGAVLTRTYDPATQRTTFTIDVARNSHPSLSLLTCPGATVLSVDGPVPADLTQALGGTTISFPSESAGTYRVVLAGDATGLGLGHEVRSCAEPTVLIDPAVLERDGVALGPATRISTLP